MLRFRDLVTEPGGNILEHRRILRRRGYVWWGWWARSHEVIPRKVFHELLAPSAVFCEAILFDRGMLRFYRTSITSVVVTPTHLGVNSPDYDATPEHYVRSRHPAWFRLEGDIVLLDSYSPRVLARPTEPGGEDELPQALIGDPIDPVALADERPTLWVVAGTEGP
jgi:hypothetical protein